MPNNYDNIAGIYDFLSRIIFQKSIVNAQIFLLKYIPANSNVLIVGGGTGWVLEELAKIKSENIWITYVEKSARMIALSKKRNYKKNEIEFINVGVEDFSTDKKFDVVFTGFLFDNFLSDKIDVIFSKLHQVLKPKGLWLYADFVNNETINKWWQKLLLKMMYLFFRITTNIEAQQLVDMRSYFNNYILIAEAFYYSGFIQSKVYEKK